MKNTAVLLFAFLVFTTTKAQKEFSVPLQNSQTDFKENNLLNGRTPALSGNFFQVTNSKKAISILPGAGTKNIKIVFNSGNAAGATITVFDQDGKKVLQQVTHLSVGDNSVSINHFNLLNEGRYSIQLNTNNEIYSSTIIVWK